MAWSDFFLPSDAQTYDEAQANYERQKALLTAQQERLDPTSDAYRINEAAISGSLEDQNAAAAAGFREGLADGAKNVKEAFTGFGLFKFVPIWVWIVAGIVAFFWIGGATWSKGRLAR